MTTHDMSARECTTGTQRLDGQRSCGAIWSWTPEAGWCDERGHTVTSAQLDLASIALHGGPRDGELVA